MSTSSRQCLVVPITLLQHPNADTLSIIKINDFQCVVKTSDWTYIKKAAYIEAESIVNTNLPQFSFLKRDGRDKERIMVRKFRGEYSQGLLVPVPDDYEIGRDCWEEFQLEHYEPEEQSEKVVAGDCCSAPPYWSSLTKYDIENFRKYSRLFKNEDKISVQEKLNGSNQSCVYSDGQYWVKSRNFWKKEFEGSDFWRGLNNNEPLKKYLMDNPNHLVQGELIGKVGGYKYGLENGRVEFCAFDIRKPDYSYMNAAEFHDTCLAANIKTAPYLAHDVQYDKDLIFTLSEGPQWNSTSGFREGCVVRPIENRFETKLNGRLILKCVSNQYLEKKK